MISEKCKHKEVFAFLKMWQIKITNNQTVLEKIIVILESNIEVRSVSSTLTNFFITKNKLLTALLQHLSTIYLNQYPFLKEDLTKILKQHEHIIPKEKYEFIFDYIVEHTNKNFYEDVSSNKQGLTNLQ